MTSHSGTTAFDETRRKRLKVLSACSECRRKKIKCNGEKPCPGCVKAKVECRYKMLTRARSPASLSCCANTTSPGTTATTATSACSSVALLQTARVNGRTSLSQSKSGASIEDIESRLCVIEDILKTILKAGKIHHPMARNNGPSHSPNASLDSASVPRTMQQEPRLRTMSPSENATHQQHTRHARHHQHHQHYQHHQWQWTWSDQRMDADKRSAGTSSPGASVIAPTPRLPTWSPPSDAVQLPPLQHPPRRRQQLPLSTSSSTSSMSSASSKTAFSSRTSWSSSPAISNLLNDEDDKSTLPDL